MKFSFKYLCAVLLISISGVLSAQTPECVTMEITYSVALAESVEMKGDALISFQGDAFHASGEGFESYSDGSSVWTIDFVSKEVYIESSTPETETYLKDLSARLSELKDGSEYSFDAPEGQAAKIKVKSIKKSAGKDISSFRPTQKFDSSWVVTDLR